MSVDKKGQEILALMLMQADASESLYSFEHNSGEVMHVSVRECDLIRNILHFAQTINASFAKKICRVAVLRLEKTDSYAESDGLDRSQMTRSLELDIGERVLKMDVTFPACISSGCISRPGEHRKLSAYKLTYPGYRERIVFVDGQLRRVEFPGLFLTSQIYAQNFGFFNVKITDGTSRKISNNDGRPDVKETTYTLEYNLSPLTKRRREMAKIAIESMIENDVGEDLVSTLQAMQNTSVCRRSSNLPYDLVTKFGSILQAAQSLEEVWSSGPWIIEITLILATASYGGIHALVWNYKFGTLAERWLWRGSCILLASTVLIMSLTRRISRGILGMLPRDTFITEFLYVCSWTLIGFVLTDILALFMVARLYIVVESFISLRSVPIGVYASIPWANAIPHL